MLIPQKDLWCVGNEVEQVLFCGSVEKGKVSNRRGRDGDNRREYHGGEAKRADAHPSQPGHALVTRHLTGLACGWKGSTARDA